MVETWNLDLLNDLNTSQIGCFILQPQKIQVLSYPLRVLIFIHHITSSPQVAPTQREAWHPWYSSTLHITGGLTKRSMPMEWKNWESTEKFNILNFPKKKKFEDSFPQVCITHTLELSTWSGRFGRRYHVEVDGFLQSNIFHQRASTP